VSVIPPLLRVVGEGSLKERADPRATGVLTIALAPRRLTLGERRPASRRLISPRDCEQTAADKGPVNPGNQSTWFAKGLAGYALSGGGTARK